MCASIVREFNSLERCRHFELRIAFNSVSSRCRWIISDEKKRMFFIELFECKYLKALSFCFSREYRQAIQFSRGIENSSAKTDMFEHWTENPWCVYWQKSMDHIRIFFCMCNASIGLGLKNSESHLSGRYDWLSDAVNNLNFVSNTKGKKHTHK